MTGSSLGTSSLPRWQIGSIVAGIAALGTVAAAQALDGGSLGSLVQWPAAIIVFAGTAAATLISYSPKTVILAGRAAVTTFRAEDEDLDALSAQLVALSIAAHRRGLLALEPELDRIGDPFLRNGLALAIDGVSSEMLRDALNLERAAHEQRDEVPARVFEAAAGYAPTLGVLGAVLGLIQVMEHLSAPSALGGGVAVAFVATVYGVGSANLVLLPIAARLRERASQVSRRRELMTEALVDVQRRLNPRYVAQRTRGFTTKLPRVDEIARRMQGLSYPLDSERPS